MRWSRRPSCESPRSRKQRLGPLGVRARPPTHRVWRRGRRRRETSPGEATGCSPAETICDKCCSVNRTCRPSRVCGTSPAVTLSRSHEKGTLSASAASAIEYRRVRTSKVPSPQRRLAPRTSRPREMCAFDARRRVASARTALLSGQTRTATRRTRGTAETGRSSPPSPRRTPKDRPNRDMRTGHRGRSAAARCALPRRPGRHPPGRSPSPGMLTPQLGAAHDGPADLHARRLLATGPRGRLDRSPAGYQRQATTSARSSLIPLPVTSYHSPTALPWRSYRDSRCAG